MITQRKSRCIARFICCMCLTMMLSLGCSICVSAAALDASEDSTKNAAVMSEPRFQSVIVPANNVSGTGSTIAEANTNVVYWYLLIRNYIAVPIMILSFASCGFKFLYCAFMGKSEYAIDAIMKQFITTIMALVLLFLLPAIMTSVKNIVENTAWKPPQSGAP